MDDVELRLNKLLTTAIGSLQDEAQSRKQPTKSRFRKDNVLGVLNITFLNNRPDWQNAFEVVIAHLNAWWDNNRELVRLVLVGDTGNGKTTLAKSAYNIASIHGVDAWYSGTWKHPSTAVFARWSEVVDARGEVFDDIAKADFAVIDDIGAEVDKFRNGGATEKLNTMLEARERKFTIITTNVPREEWKIRWDKRVASRMHHRAIVCELKGNDLRRTM